MVAIKVQNLSKTFKNFKAVRGIDFEVGENRVVGFLGPNGAGKTTTIRMLVGLSEPSDGEIEIAGQKVTFGSSVTNANTGYLPEQPAFYGWMTGQEYLNFIAGIFNIEEPKKNKRIEELLSLVNLKEAGIRKISGYSNGMKQRLGIAQALINDPKVLIMDEPVSALDPIGRREVLEIIGQLKKDKTIFLSTHILSDVDRICDDVIIINKGKIVTTSPLPELKEKYATSILEVEFTRDPGDAFNAIDHEDWAERFEKDGNTLRIWLKDTSAVESNLPLKRLMEPGIGIIKYGQALPSVEDLFVSLLEDKK